MSESVNISKNEWMNEGLKNWKTDWMNEWVERNEWNEMSGTEQ